VVASEQDKAAKPDMHHIEVWDRTHQYPTSRKLGIFQALKISN